MERPRKLLGNERNAIFVIVILSQVTKWLRSENWRWRDIFFFSLVLAALGKEYQKCCNCWKKIALKLIVCTLRKTKLLIRFFTSYHFQTNCITNQSIIYILYLLCSVFVICCYWNVQFIQSFCKSSVKDDILQLMFDIRHFAWLFCICDREFFLSGWSAYCCNFVVGFLWLKLQFKFRKVLLIFGEKQLIFALSVIS